MRNAQGRLRVLLEKYTDKTATEAEVNDLYDLISTKDQHVVGALTYAEEKGYKIKLVAHASKLCNDKVAAFVLPQFVTDENQLHNVRNEFNGVVIESKLADKPFLYGRGA